MRDIDHIAAFAMMGLLAKGGKGMGAKVVAIASYQYAEAVLNEMRARSKREMTIEAQLREGGKGQ